MLSVVGSVALVASAVLCVVLSLLIVLAVDVPGVVVVGSGFQQGESSAWTSSNWNHKSLECDTTSVQSADAVVTSRTAIAKPHKFAQLAIVS